MQISPDICDGIVERRYAFDIGLVWRLSKSAFLCGGFGRRTFIFRGKIMKRKVIYEAKHPHAPFMMQDEYEGAEDEKDTEAPKVGYTGLYKGICVNTQYTPIPRRNEESERFIKEAIYVSELYQTNIRIIRLDGHIRVYLAFDFGIDMQSIGRLFDMADSISFFKDKSEHDLAVCLDFYTHVVLTNGLAIAP